ncbi:MAG: tRNA adenosine(34) deaminase TadA, partial [Actinomyces sp.]|nr:tRNA adenosine(34) deaminase TadA [Actinomyces sp.]
MVSSERLREAMGRALFLANHAREGGDVPVGAVVLDSQGRVVGEGWNRREQEHDPSAHAEILALREAGQRLGRWNLVGCTLVVTLEPCTMCAGAAVQARVDSVVFAAWDPKAGAAGSVRDVLRDSRLNHRVEVVGGVLEEEATVQLKGFFQSMRPEPASRAASTSVPARSRPRSWERGQVPAPGGTEQPAVVLPDSPLSPTRATPSSPSTSAGDHSLGVPLPSRRERVRGRRRGGDAGSVSSAASATGAASASAGVSSRVPPQMVTDAAVRPEPRPASPTVPGGV